MKMVKIRSKIGQKSSKNQKIENRALYVARYSWNLPWNSFIANMDFLVALKVFPRLILAPWILGGSLYILPKMCAEWPTSKRHISWAISSWGASEPILETRFKAITYINARKFSNFDPGPPPLLSPWNPYCRKKVPLTPYPYRPLSF